MMSCNDKLSGNEGNTRKGGGGNSSKDLQIIEGEVA